MGAYVERSGLKVAVVLDNLLQQQILPGLTLTADEIWQGFAQLVNDLSPKNKALLIQRDHFQQQLDQWSRDNPGLAAGKLADYRRFLTAIGYLLPEGEDFEITTANVDAEISTIAGPQLVAPVNNARFALNATNARWGSLYDALYGSDAIAEDNGFERGNTFNELRAMRVIARAVAFLDDALPLDDGYSHGDVAEYCLRPGEPGKIIELELVLTGGVITQLAEPEKLVGYSGELDRPQSILFKNNQLHIEIQFDRSHPIGKNCAAGIKDILLEAAITTIQDCEEAVAAVDADDKAILYRNWLGLMKGTLTDSFDKNGETVTRSLNADRHYIDVNGQPLRLHGRSLLLVRNVGHLMMTDAILDQHGQPIPEGFMDALFTTLCALHDLQGDGAIRNSRAGSLYIVKPKMHGPEEVALADELFSRIEALLGLPHSTLKMGLMDEERRTTINLKECIRAVKSRLVFINTGFQDRTGDEIHTAMEMGAVLPKESIKQQPWISAYENWNVDIGLACGLPGRAQIGKGMWPKPDEMTQMLGAKWVHPEAGANCAWVPSPTAATLHAIHYHQVNVVERQAELKQRPRASLDDLLLPPLLGNRRLTEEEIQEELDNNAQGILGYVVRWVDQGVGCSKVPDINHIALLEDRATLRISSQHIANWLRHGICSEAQVLETMRRMARIVDEQNAGDPAYQPMAPRFNSTAFRSACALVFEGGVQPNGYTEPLLHAYRRKVKDKASSVHNRAATNEHTAVPVAAVNEAAVDEDLEVAR